MVLALGSKIIAGNNLIVSDNESGGGLEIGDIGIAPLGIDETQNKRRYLNGQLIVQSQFVSFTNRVKEAVQLYPNLVTTETNWQAEVTNSKLGQCGKFVIDDEAGTIRLPKVVNINGLQNLASLGGIKAESLPNIIGEFEIVNKTPTGDMVFTGVFEKGVQINTPVTGLGAGNSWVDGWGFTREKFNANKSSSIYQNDAPVQQEAVQYPYFIQVATGVEESIDTSKEIELNNPFSLFDFKRSDHLLNNLSWLRADTFSWQDGNVYHSAYNELLSEYTNPACTEETDGDIVYRRTPKGYKIAGGSQASKIEALYNSKGVAWYYIIDGTNQRFKLPRTKYDFVGVRSGVGNYVDESLPNITGSAYIDAAITAPNGVFEGGSNNYGGETSGSRNNWLKFNASKVSSTYKDNAPVQQRSTETYLYFYVGETVQGANLINMESNLLDVADLKKNTLKTNQITNCITEIPQDIKLELNNGTLILKAGSKLYIPNGFETDGVTPKFDVITSANDFIFSTGFPGGVVFLFYNGYGRMDIKRVNSGPTAPTNPSNHDVWYDTSNNKIKGYQTEQSAWIEQVGCSLTLGIATANADGTGYVSIDQVFNGFGYIGSTVFALPSVKGLIPNGRNADGSLKNIEVTTTSVLTFTPSFYGSSVLILGSNNLTSWGKSDYSYSNDDNYNYFKDGKHYALCKIGEYYKDSTGVITSFTPKTTFHAVDRNDSSWLSGLGMPSNRYIDLTLGASGATYTAPADGWVCFDKNTGGADRFIAIEVVEKNTDIKIYGTRHISQNSNFAISDMIPILKNQQFKVYYNTAGNTEMFRFIYAEGSK